MSWGCSIRNRFTKALLLSALCLMFFALPLAAANRADMDRGIEEYQRGAYEKALKTFRETYGQGLDEDNVYASLSLFMIIKCEYELGNYGPVVSESRIFERNFPGSRYLPDVLFERAKALIRKQQFSPAMLSGIRILSISSDEALRSDAMDLCEDLSRYYLSPRELEMLLPLVIGRKSLSYFKLLLAQNYIIAGDLSKAEAVLQDVKSELYTERFVQKYKAVTKYFNKSKKPGDPEINVAIVLPLTGKYSETGNQLLEGIKFAYESARDQNSKRVNLIIVDTGSKVRSALKALKETLEIQNVTAVLGPLNSETAISMAPLCEYAGVPMITPTATADGLTEMGEYVFQLNPEQQRRGLALADFTSDSLGYTRYAVVAPATEYGTDISGAFKRGVEKNGGRIISHVWYSGTPSDINDKLEALKETAEYLPPYFSYLDGYDKARASGLFDRDSSQAEESVIDSVMDDPEKYDPREMDSLYAATGEDINASPQDTVFLLEALWPGDSMRYAMLIQELQDSVTAASDTLFQRFWKHADQWLSGEISLEEKYHTRITDSLCILLETMKDTPGPEWLSDFLADMDTTRIDSQYMGDFQFSPLVADTVGLEPYIDMKKVDSLKAELKSMDSLSAIWLLAETDPQLFPYIFPEEDYGIDAVYMPVPRSHIKYIAPQWAKHRFDALLLGDGNWYNTSILNRYRSNIDSMLIASDYYWDSRDITLRRFARDFQRKTGRQANRIHIYGYESMDLLMKIIDQDADSPEKIRKGLYALEGEHGIIRHIRFEPEHPRSSSGVRIIRFYKGKISPLR